MHFIGDKAINPLELQNNTSSSKLNKILIPISLLFGLVAIFYIRYGDRENVLFFTKEDGVVENLSATFYLVGFFISLISVFRKEHALLSIVWAALCLLFLGEETSWFQRYLEYSVPFVEQRSLQHEFNIHNLAIFGKYTLTDLLSEFDLKMLLNVLLSPETLFQIGFFGYFVIIPLSLYISKINTLLSNIGYKKTDTSFILVILYVIAMTFILAFNCSSEGKHDLAETREMLYAYFIMIYIISYIYTNTPRQTQV
jgi:hypothetical protein